MRTAPSDSRANEEFHSDSRANQPGRELGEEVFANSGGSISDREGWFAEWKRYPGWLWIPNARSGIDHENSARFLPVRWLQKRDWRMPAIAVWLEPDQ